MGREGDVVCAYSGCHPVLHKKEFLPFMTTQMNLGTLRRQNKPDTEGYCLVSYEYVECEQSDSQWPRGVVVPRGQE